MEPFFFMNYGGPGGYSLTHMPERAMDLIKVCMETYIGGKKFYRYVDLNIKGIDLRIHSFGIHRAITVHLPSPQPTEEQVRLFELLYVQAKQICDTDYATFSHNCVTSVAQLLNTIDNKLIMDTTLTMPWGLDKQINQYCGFYCKETTAGIFIEKYQAKVKSNNVETPFWSKKRIDHLKDIVVAYEVKGDELTKKSLLELGWVKEGRGEKLIISDKAPKDFQDAFNTYFNEQKQIAHIQDQYQEHSRLDRSPEEERYIFGTNHDLNTIIERLKIVAAKPTSTMAAKQTLKSFDPELLSILVYDQNFIRRPSCLTVQQPALRFQT